MDTVEEAQKKVLEDYLLDLCLEVENPKAVSLLVEVILRSQQNRLEERRPAGIAKRQEESLTP
jgi:hypothetical protein